MKNTSTFLLVAFFSCTLFYSCSKQELFKSEKEVKKELQGIWKLIPIPKYDIVNGDSVVHIETWTFDDSKVTIVNSGQTATSTYSVSTSISSSEFSLDGVSPDFSYPARVRNINGTWRIVTLDDEFLIIANDQNGSTGVTELEFQKQI